MPDKFDATYRLRQKILDFLNETPGEHSTTTIAEKIYFCRDYVCRAIRTMVEKEEVKRHGPQWNARYSPLKTITHLAETARTQQRGPKPKQKPESINTKPGRFIRKHTDDDNDLRTLSGDPVPKGLNHGGQGAVRNKVSIKSCMG